MVGDPPWWDRARHADRRPRLVVRARIKAGIRAHLEYAGFQEVECAALAVSPGNETHLHAFATELIDNEGASRRRYLHTSPEFAMKKLVAAGEARIFEFARVWRNGERSRTHHPEFTMLEWYRAHQPWTALMEDCAAFLRIAADGAGAREISYRGRRCNPRLEPERLSLAEAFERYAGIDLMAGLAVGLEPDRELLAGQMRAKGLRVADDDSWSDLFSAVLVTQIEPHLGEGRATILHSYPVSEAALARPSPEDGRVAERFEFYVAGVELANAFGELTDAAEQRRRFEADMDLKQAIYGERYPIDEDFLAALAVMPPTSGAALGFDRLVMLATGAERIEDVLWVPVARP